MEFHPKCPLPLLQLEGSERKNINGTNTLLAIFRDQKICGDYCKGKGILTCQKIVFHEEIYIFLKICENAPVNSKLENKSKCWDVSKKF
jgi:hypothetical protein